MAEKDNYGIDIINMSLGSGTYSSTGSCDGSSSIYLNAVHNATNAGITVIAASGNDGLCNALSRPACFSDVISVGAVYDAPQGNIGWCVNRNSCANTQRHPGCPPQMRAAFENALADNVIVYSNSANFLDVVAPSTCANAPTPGGGMTNCFGGTSSATPFTAGIAALAVQAGGKGQITPANMRALLLETGEHVTDPKNGRVSPRVNGDSVVNAALSYTGSDPNPPPVAGFTYDCTDLSCKFDGTSSSGTIISHDWTFGSDGGSDSGSNVSHSFSTGGTYEVILTVTDDESASDSDTQSVTVTSSPPGSIALSANSYKVKGIKHADLTWTGALGSDVDIYFDDSPLATSNNDGAYTHNIGTRGGGSHSYQVCEAGTSTCSNIVPAVF